MPDGQYFKENEFLCPCCGVVKLNPKLIPKLDLIRMLYNKPMVITSGYRCPTHNAELSGGPEHVAGEAADVACTSDRDRYTLVKACYSVGIKRIGIGKGFIHIGISESLPEFCVWLY